MTSFDKFAHQTRKKGESLANSPGMIGQGLTVQDLLDRLDDVRDRGNSQWLARCPAHEDSRASLSIKETDEGVVLLHCFAACSPDQVVATVGLELADLFPQKLIPRKSVKPRWSYKDLLLVIRHEALVMEIAASRFESLMPDEIERVVQAGQRIRNALEVANVR